MNDPTDMEVMEEQGIQVVPGYALMKAENDSLMFAARTNPRNIKKCLNTALTEIKMIPEEAKTMFYMIPYKDNRTQKITNVSGLSIKAAQMIARIWGNCLVSGKVVDRTDDTTTVEGTFIDAETNYRYSRQLVISHFIKARGGSVYKMDDQKIMQAIGAGQSKAIRNAVLGGISAAVLNKIYQTATEIAAGKVAEVVPQLITAFANMGVTEAMLTKKIGCALMRATSDDIATLMGYGSAIKDGLTTVEEVFADEAKVEEAHKQAITVDDVMHGQAETPEPAPEHGPPPAPAPAAAPAPAPAPAPAAAPSKRKVSW